MQHVEAIAPSASGKDASRLEPTHSEWSPQIIEYTPEILLDESPGAQARRLWEERFANFAELGPERSGVLFTGIGGGIGQNAQIPVRRFPDGSLIPPYFKLKAHFGEVPKVLFLMASTPTSDHVNALKGLAEEYKEQGVEVIIPVLTALAHERQDHHFFTEDGTPIWEVTTLKPVIKSLAEGGEIDAALLIQPHSLRPVVLGLRSAFPILPIDAFEFLVRKAKLDQISKPFVIGPDKGRRDEGRRLAAFLRCQFAAASKTRARLADGYPTVTIPDSAKMYMRENNLTALTFDDEVREGGTIGELARGLVGYAEGLEVCVGKPFFAGAAVDQLNQDIIRRVAVTDAVEPLTDLTPIRSKLEVHSLESDLMSLVDYLRHNLIRPDNPDWLRDPEATGTLLRLNLTVEHYT